MNNDILERLKSIVLFEKVTPELHQELNKFLKTELGGEWETYIQIQPTGDSIINCHRCDKQGTGSFVIEVTASEFEALQ